MSDGPTGAGPVPLLEGLGFPEGPRAHGDDLFFSDIGTHRVHRLDAEGTFHTLATFEDRPSGLGVLPTGEVLVALMRTRRVARIHLDGQVSIWSDCHEHCDDMLNDMVVDAGGNAWVGAIDPDGEGRLVLVRPGGESTVVADGIAFPNGSVLTPEGRLVVAATRGEVLWSFRVEADGGLSDRRAFAELPGLTPDGVCLDAEGALWVATVRDGGFVRVREGGEITDRIAMDADRWAVACALGGTTLYLASSRSPESGLEPERTHGRIDTVTVDVPAAAGPKVQAH